MEQNSPSSGVITPLYHPTRLDHLMDFFSDEADSLLLPSDESDSDTESDEDSYDSMSEGSDAEASSKYDCGFDPAESFRDSEIQYLSGTQNVLDLEPSTIAALQQLKASTLEDMKRGGWEDGLRRLFNGTSTPAYRVCRRHGLSKHYFLQATRDLKKNEAIGVLVGRLIESNRWEEEDEKGDHARPVHSLRWEISAESLQKLRSDHSDQYTGPDLILDLSQCANELIHLRDPFGDEQGLTEEANTELFTSLIKDPTTQLALPTTVLYANKSIKKGDTLTATWDDEWWVEFYQSQAFAAATTALGSLHFPLLKLRSHARQLGIPVEFIAPYYAEERERYKKLRKICKGVDAQMCPVSTSATGGEESSYFGTFNGRGDTDIRALRRNRNKRRNFMYFSGDSWWLDDGNEPRKIVHGIEEQVCNLPNPPLDRAFKPVSNEKLERMPCYTTTSDFSAVPDSVKRKFKKAVQTNKRTVRFLRKNEVELIRTGKCPKVQVTEVLSLHHPVRYLTRPDKPAYGTNVKAGCTLKRGEAIGVYIGYNATIDDYVTASSDLDKQLYTYDLLPYNVATALGFPQEWALKNAEDHLPVLMVDAYKAGNKIRFMNDVFAREGSPRANVVADTVVDPDTGLPYILLRWNEEKPSDEMDELICDYGGRTYWKVAARALHKELKRHAEVAYTSMERLKAALRERGVEEETIQKLSEPVDVSKIMYYVRDVDVDP